MENNNLMPIEDEQRIFTWGKISANSKLFPGITSGEQACVCILAGREIGLSMIQSLIGGVHIIKGKPVYSAHALAGYIRSEYPNYDYHIKELTNAICTIEFVRPERKESNILSYTMADAVRTGRAEYDNYKKHPRNMLFARCISDGTKFFFPDLFRGNAYAEGDFIEQSEQTEPPINVTPPQESTGPVVGEAVCFDFYSEIKKLATEKGIENIKEKYPEEHKTLKELWDSKDWKGVLEELDNLNKVVNRFGAGLDELRTEPELPKGLTKVPPEGEKEVDAENATTEQAPKEEIKDE